MPVFEQKVQKIVGSATKSKKVQKTLFLELLPKNDNVVIFVKKFKLQHAKI